MTSMRVARLQANIMRNDLGERVIPLTKDGVELLRDEFVRGLQFVGAKGSRGWGYAVYDKRAGAWREAGPFASYTAARAARQVAWAELALEHFLRFRGFTDEDVAHWVPLAAERVVNGSPVFSAVALTFDQAYRERYGALPDATAADVGSALVACMDICGNRVRTVTGYKTAEISTEFDGAADRFRVSIEGRVFNVFVREG